MGCKCGETSNMFEYSSKLRVPKIKNKVKFRKFLKDCPIFVNMIEEHQQEKFRTLLRYIKLYRTKINGFDWTYIE